MSRVIGSSSLIQFETNDIYAARWAINRSTLHSYAAASPSGENGQRVHIYQINLMPAPLTVFTAYFETAEARDQSLMRLLEQFDIEDPFLKAAVQL